LYLQKLITSNLFEFQAVGGYKYRNMIRTIIKAEKRILEISLPLEFIGKEIEVIAFLLEEATLTSIPASSQKTFSAIRLDTRGFKFNREEANER